MAEKKHKCITPWFQKTIPSSEIVIHVGGVSFTLDRELLASKSGKVAQLLKNNKYMEHDLFLDIPADAQTFEQVARFCCKNDAEMSSENIIPLICLAFYLEMSGEGNLLSLAVSYFEHKIIPIWNQTIKAFKVAENFLQQTMNLGIFDACLESLVDKALVDPRLLGEPLVLKNNLPSTRRRLFATTTTTTSEVEDLSKLPLQLYEPTIRAMTQNGVPLEYISASVCQYAKRWIFSSSCNNERNVIETLERLLPHGRNLVPCTLLVQLLGYANSLEASPACRKGFEIRIGRQLDQATTEDLLTSCQGYDIECVKRILKSFYSSFPDISGLAAVGLLMENFLVQVGSDVELKVETFVSLAEMSMAASLGGGVRGNNCDGIYRAIDVYLDKHRYLTEEEKEEVCRVLDCEKLSPEACEHASKNKRLPVRVMVQVLFMTQLQLRHTIAKGMRSFDEKLIIKEQVVVNEDEDEIQKMSSKVMELERECYLMKKEIENGCSSSRKNQFGRKESMWRELKRKFGCTTNMHQCDCHVKQQQQKKKKKVHHHNHPPQKI